MEAVDALGKIIAKVGNFLPELYAALTRAQVKFYGRIFNRPEEVTVAVAKLRERIAYMDLQHGFADSALGRGAREGRRGVRLPKVIFADRGALQW